MNFYDPVFGRIWIAPGGSLYARYHEEAHRAQHAELSRLFVFWWKVKGIRFLEYVALLLVEVDAYRRARRRMIAEGSWTAAHAEEARLGLLSYLKRQERNANVVC